MNPMFLCAFVVVAIYIVQNIAIILILFIMIFINHIFIVIVLVVNWAYIVICCDDFQQSFESYNSLSDEF